MRLSIIVPVYNMEADDKLKHCLDSLLDQSVDDIEIIAVDDASTDGSAAILKEYEEKRATGRGKEFHAIYCAENHRQGGARNRGMKEARGEWIGFMDSDDYAETDYLESMITVARENDSDVVISGSHYIDEKGFVIENLNYPIDIYPEYPMRRLSPHGKLYRLDFLNRHNIRFVPGKLYEDNPFNLMALFLCRNCVTLPVARHYQVIHPGSSMASRMTSDKIPYDALEKALLYVKEHEDEINDRDVYEFTVLSFFTYFIFLGNREHMQIALNKSAGCKYSTEMIAQLCDFTQRLIPVGLPNYYRNRYIGIFRERELQFRHRAGVWLFTKLIRTHTLKAFAMLYYFFVR